MPIRAFVEHDDTAITADSVWTTKFAKAPGALPGRDGASIQRLSKKSRAM